jgi:hypothetical protein
VLFNDAGAIGGDAGFTYNKSTDAGTIGALGISSGNLTFSSTAQRITGDFGNATLSNRLMFQNSVVNAGTNLGVIPNGTNTNVSFLLFNNSDPANAGFAQFIANTNEARFAAGITGTGSYVPITFQVGGSERARIETDGDVGIGTSTLVGGIRLTVLGGGTQLSPGTAAQEGLRIQRATGYATLTGINNDNNAYNGLQLFTGASAAVTVDTSGNVGIGTASPGSKLDVNRGSAGLIANFTDGVNANFQITTASLVTTIGPSAGSTALVLQSSGSERMRIDSSGNVGIGGTAQNNTKLQILGTMPVDSGSTNSSSFFTGASVPSSITGTARGFISNITTDAASFTLSNLVGFEATRAVFGAGSTVTNHFGFFANVNLTAATNNYGFYSDIASGSNRWNFFANGSAANYFAGNTGVGTTPDSARRLDVKGSGTTGATVGLSVRNSSDTFILICEDDGYLRSPSTYNLTSGSAANVFIDSNGRFFRSTSSLRYKSDVTNAAHGLAEVLKLRSVTYKGHGANDGDTVFGGLIAEEVHDAGLTEFVAYDKEGRPDAIHYGNMVALLVKAVQELTARVAELEAK